MLEIFGKTLAHREAEEAEDNSEKTTPNAAIPRPTNTGDHVLSKAFNDIALSFFQSEADPTCIYIMKSDSTI